MSLYEAITQMVQSIPEGAVTSYESIAQILSDVSQQQIEPTVVSDILLTLPEDERHLTPWWRVVAHDGRVVSMDEGMLGLAQIRLLEDEGVQVSEEGYVDMSQYQSSRE